MIDAKALADTITFGRAFLGMVMVWIGVMEGERAVPSIIVIMLLCWIGDFVDGGIARHSRNPRHTFIGDHDVYVDVFVSLCLGAYLLASGFVGWTITVFYILAWALLFWRFELNYNLLMLVQLPIYLYFIWIALQLHSNIGIWLVVWILMAVAINWRRFTRQIVPNFIAGMKSLRNNRKYS